MLTAHLSRRYLWGVVGICLTAGVVVWGCAPQELPQPQQPPADVSRRLATMEECIARSQGAVNAAAAAGVSAATLAPANSSIADVQDAVDEVTKLVQQGKPQEAADRATKGLEECEKIDSMVAKARQDEAERKLRVQMASEAETRIAWTVACIDGARQAIGRASTAGVKTADLTAALGGLDRERPRRRIAKRREMLLTRPSLRKGRRLLQLPGRGAAAETGVRGLWRILG